MQNLKNVVLVTIAIMFLLTIKTLEFNPADVETIQNTVNALKGEK